ncbi:hypothetical protein MGWOODY_Clf938 [hydrothermal vent metagenome]|uniref:Uncharacterized protein n=1 Tax=hydrothermal vent metagenome TaxID=652676 RepID=A0A160V9L6_9ZZZZ
MAPKATAIPLDASKNLTGILAARLDHTSPPATWDKAKILTIEAADDPGTP